MNRLLSVLSLCLPALCLPALSLLALAGVSPAAAAERVAIIPLAASGDVTPPIAEQFRGVLRRLAAAEAEALPEAEVQAAMGRAGVAVGCRTEACAVGLAGATGARFVLAGAVGSVDEIYTVELALYDRALNSRQSAKGTCELCAAGEVDRTIASTFAQLAPMLRVAAAAPVTPAAPEPIGVEVQTVPDGARVFVDGAARGQAPIVLKVEPGPHTVAVELEGFERAERSISAVDRPVKVAFRLTPATPVAAAPAPVVTPPVVAPTPVAPAPTASGGGGHLYTGIGMLVGGALLTGGGAYLIILDGDVTCTDGRGRRECPKVFNTKGFGMGAFGVGAALVGAGTTLVILHALADEPAVTPTVAPGADGGAMMGLSGRF
ncbi:MAG: PEGA domain-containing protein [Myxococcales bacterium]|nr:PEGA domain-containing protein [Myxococcales bacterium]